MKNLTDSNALLRFVDDSLSGKQPYFWLSEKPKKEKKSIKVVGDSFKARVFDTKRDALVLIYHPIAHKNRGLKDKFESFASAVDSEKLLVARVNGINESSVFKNPGKLPAIVHFSSADLESEGSTGEVVEAPFGLTASPRVKEQTEY